MFVIVAIMSLGAALAFMYVLYTCVLLLVAAHALFSPISGRLGPHLNFGVDTVACLSGFRCTFLLFTLFD